MFPSSLAEEQALHGLKHTEEWNKNTEGKISRVGGVKGGGNM